MVFVMVGLVVVVMVEAGMALLILVGVLYLSLC